MNILKRIVTYIRNIFIRQEKMIEPTTSPVRQNTQKEFITSLKESYSTYGKTNKMIETLICNGDGLGIKKDIDY